MELPPVGYQSGKKVFTDKQEKELTEYLMRAADAFYGLCPREVKELAYQLAVKHGCKYPKSWDKFSRAGPDWFSAYMKRNPTLSIRSAEATSLARATSFNQHNVAMFFKKIDEVLKRHTLTANDIWNIDETGITTVQTPDRVIAKRGTKQVGAMTSAERGSLVTLACVVNPIGNTIPPMFVFPRIRYADHFVRDGPVGSIGSGNKSGWMQETEFLIFLKHFANHTKVSNGKKKQWNCDTHISPSLQSQTPTT
ncbi:uncharacterized protein LOC120745201 [Simochromis diagramma]|uniref:uncharacterized protein LOC120745201 n=1 Tax=Simochromis diagramma TaxID=43689 RepID=UPI001A7E82C5|nr:uncharacterized protein LOC120745201 [Simochromis diagramma]